MRRGLLVPVSAAFLSMMSLCRINLARGYEMCNKCGYILHFKSKTSHMSAHRVEKATYRKLGEVEQL